MSPGKTTTTPLWSPTANIWSRSPSDPRGRSKTATSAPRVDGAAGAGGKRGPTRLQRPPITERTLRPIAAIINHRHQIWVFEKLLAQDGRSCEVHSPGFLAHLRNSLGALPRGQDSVLFEWKKVNRLSGRFARTVVREAPIQQTLPFVVTPLAHPNGIVPIHNPPPDAR